ncbi:MAG: PAS domain S-box protein [Desulfatibacillaceae bacterium]
MSNGKSEKSTRGSAFREPEDEQRFRTLFNRMKSAFALHEIICDAEGNPVDYRFLEVNPAFEREVGQTADQIVGSTVLETFPETEGYWIRMYGKVALDGQTESFTRYSAAMGKWYEGVAYCPGHGRFAVVFDDVTERVLARQALRRSEKRFRLLHETIPQGIVHQDAQGRIISANPAAERILGLGVDQMRGLGSSDTRWDAIREDGARFPGEEHPASVALKEGREVRGVVMGILRAGETNHRWITVDAVPLFRKGEARPYMVYTSFSDITEQVRAQRELEKSEERLRRLYEASPDAFFLIDLQGNVIECNQAAVDMLGYPKSRLVGMNYHEFTPPAWYEAEDAILREQVLVRGYSDTYEKEYVDAGGRVFPVELRVFCLRDESGNPERMWGFVRDVTRRKAMEEEREKLIARLEKSNEELRRFSYTVSHDLKGPLVTIRGYLALLEKAAESGNYENLGTDVGRISMATENMSSLVDDLLDLSRIGRHEQVMEEVPVSLVAAEAREMAAGYLEERGVVVDIQPDMPRVRAVRDRLRQVYENLFSNAARYMGEQLEPRVRAGVVREKGGDVFFVRDNGIGIAPEDQERVFQVFEKLNPRHGGTGMGLAIVRRIVEAHGGGIRVDSRGRGSGCTFWFTLGSESGNED